jgi:hypothetical protein
MDAPNAVWTTDCKGQFRTRDGQYCYPLTVVDGDSRYLLGCQGLRSTSIELARPVFGRPFASKYASTSSAASTTTTGMAERKLRIEDDRGRWIRRRVLPMSPD